MEPDVLKNTFSATGISFISPEDLNPANAPDDGVLGFDGDAKRTIYNLQSAGNGQALQTTINLPEDLRLTPDEREQKKKKDEAFLNELMRLQEQIGQSNERIGEFIQQYETMARWYREQAAKAAEAMDKIAERMAKNSEFINDAKELIENGRTGQLDREKARRLLLERGIKTEEDVSNERLLELLERERLKAIQNKGLS